MCFYFQLNKIENWSSSSVFRTQDRFLQIIKSKKPSAFHVVGDKDQRKRKSLII